MTFKGQSQLFLVDIILLDQKKKKKKDCILPVMLLKNYSVIKNNSFTGTNNCPKKI